VNVKVVSSNSSGIDVSATLEIEIQRRGERIAKHQMKTVIPAYTQDFAETWTVNLPKSKVELWHTDFSQPLYQHDNANRGKSTLPFLIRPFWHSKAGGGWW
jgi:hypothetical protein